MNTRILDNEVHRELIKQRIRLLKEHSFFASLLLHLDLEEVDDVPTMATDGVGLYYNSDFVRSLSSIELQVVLLHEVLHCALGHIWRRGTRDPERWNYAADYAVNAIIVEEGYALPDGALYDETFRGMSAEKIYTLLPEELGCSLLDSHQWWGKVRKSRRNYQGSTHASSTEQGKTGTEKDLEEEWKKRVARAAQAARMQGDLPGSIGRLVKDILEPKLDWRAILKDRIVSYSKNDFRWLPPSKKHLWRGMCLPSVYAEQLEIAVAIDSSGSVSEEQYQAFLAELKGIGEQFANYMIHLFLSDASIHDVIEISNHDEWHRSFPKTDGGTSFVPVFEEVTRRNLQISTLIYLTDGYGSAPDYPPHYPVLWVLNTDCEMPWGETIRLDVW